jgi:hypothetical protein
MKRAVSSVSAAMGTSEMDKFDVRKAFKALYAPAAGAFAIVDVPAFTFLMTDGEGNPNTASAYKEAVEALYSASYTLKFMAKAELGHDYVVPPLEGLWWADDWNAFIAGRRDRWNWTMMILVPDFVGTALAERAIQAAARKRALPGLARLRLDRFDEGRAVQTLHIGPYADEGPVIRRMHEEFIPANRLSLTGKHHEIYLGDPRRSAPEKLKTILRQPVR